MGTIALTYDDIVRSVESIVRDLAGDEQVAIWPEQLEQDRVGFVIVSRAFANMTHLERQQRLWEAIREKLGPGAVRVAAIFPRTPDEVV